MVTEEECIEALKRAAERLAKSPTKAEYEALGLRPSSGTIKRVMNGWNHAKEAAGLEVYTQAEGNKRGIQPKPPDVDVPIDLEWTELSPQQRWYYKNREHRIEVKDRRRKEIKIWLYEYKRDECSCERCGEQFPGALDFHHAGVKEADISVMANHGYSRQRILSEIERCEVLCANCHQKEHFWESSEKQGDELLDMDTQDEPWTHPDLDSQSYEWRRRALRSWVQRYKVSNGGCARCKETEPICLEFHHLGSGDGTTSINRLIASASSKERFLEEFEKCEILCRNCHRKEHYEFPDPVN